MRRVISGFIAGLIALLLIAPPSADAAKKKKADQEDVDMTFEEDEGEDIGKSGPPSKTLDRARKLYDKKDYYSASIEFFKVIKGESGDSEANRQKAEFFMGKTLYQMKFYAAAL